MSAANAPAAVVVRAHGGLYRWDRSEVTRVASADGLPMLTLGSMVRCHLGRTSGKGRKMSDPKSYGGETGLIVISFVHHDLDDQPDEIEFAVMLGKGIVWFAPEQLELVPVVAQEADHAC
jgi:hypothetical protein